MRNDQKLTTLLHFFVNSCLPVGSTFSITQLTRLTPKSDLYTYTYPINYVSEAEFVYFQLEVLLLAIGGPDRQRCAGVKIWSNIFFLSFSIFLDIKKLLKYDY